MCGLTGFLGGETSRSTDDTNGTIRRMVASIEHRGPDDNGFWHDSEAGIVVGHVRLSILEISHAGSQPMHSASRRYVIAYNGEIYNHLDLRNALAEQGGAPDWHGHSDTETLLAAIEHWGVERALQSAVGMFAFSLWDRKTRTLYLARDRAGEKPLYYGWQGNGANRTFLFGSELKALVQHPQFNAPIDREALTAFMRFGYVPAPHSIYRDIAKLPPGTFGTLRENATEIEIRPYWSARGAITSGRENLFQGSPNEAVDELERLLLDAVGKQMMADVPLGAFLSGGIDSSAIVALMQAQAGSPVKTFSIGFHEEGYNEAKHAKSVARHLGTEHTELYVTAKEAQAVIPDLPAIYDEPFADASQIPTFLVSKMARSHVTVALSGDAGDELFCGYDRYGLTDSVWRRIKNLPAPARKLAARALMEISPNSWNHLAKLGGKVMPALGRLPNPGRKIHKGARILGSNSAGELYRGIVSHWTEPEDLVLGGSGDAPDVWLADRWDSSLSDVENMMAVDLMTYLPNDILTKVDRAAMAVSLEARVPFLDHRVIEFAWRVPMDMKLRDGKTKWILRQVLDRYVPASIMDRPKMGFGLPIDRWLRGSLREWAEELLDPVRLKTDGYFDVSSVRKMWDLHLSGDANVEYLLWDVLMFQAWANSAKDPLSGSSLLPN